MRDAFLHKVRSTIARHSMLGDRDSILVAVSGGPDSVALLRALVALDPGDWRLAVAHVNHHLRGRDSDADQRFVERLAGRFGVPAFTADGAIPPGGNLEERARKIRYQRLAEIARRERFRRVATGHTRDDQAETFLLRLLRGAGRGGLGGIEPVRNDGVVRPLLECTRAEILGFLESRGLGFRIDRTNTSDRFTRNRIRRRLLPLLEREFNPRAKEALTRTAELLREEEEWLERVARDRLRQVAKDGGLDAGRLSRLPNALARRIVRAWVVARRAGAAPLAAVHVEKTLALAHRGRDGASVSIPGGRISRSGGVLRWGLGAGSAQLRPVALGLGDTTIAGAWAVRVRSVRRRDDPKPTQWRAVADQAGLAGRRLRVRAPLAGDRVRPIGLGGSKKLQDIFVDAKVPREDRSGWAVVTAGNEILWVPGLVRGDVARVTPRSRRLVVLEARRVRVAAVFPMCYRRKSKENRGRTAPA